jgi:hypothetical protein
MVKLFPTLNNGTTFGLILTEFCFVLQEKTDPDKNDEPEGKPNWRERIRSLSKLQLIVCKFCFVGSGMSLDKEGSFVAS